MSYITLDDLKKAIPEESIRQLTDDEDVGSINEDRVTDAIAAAQGELDGYLQERYTVPLDPVPDLIKRLTVDIAIYNLCGRQGLDIPEARTDRYRNAVKTLEKIANGTISLGVTPSVAETNAGTVSFTSNTRVFTKTTLENF